MPTKIEIHVVYIYLSLSSTLKNRRSMFNSLSFFPFSVDREKLNNIDFSVQVQCIGSVYTDKHKYTQQVHYSCRTVALQYKNFEKGEVQMNYIYIPSILVFCFYFRDLKFQHFIKQDFFFYKGRLSVQCYIKHLHLNRQKYSNMELVKAYLW